MANIKEELLEAEEAELEAEEFDENAENYETKIIDSKGELVEKIRGQKGKFPPYAPEENTICAPVIEEGCSKLDFDYPENIRTLSPDNLLLSKLLPATMCENVEAIVGMALSKDCESVEVRILMTKEELTDLCCLMNVFHACMAVLGNFFRQMTRAST